MVEEEEEEKEEGKTNEYDKRVNSDLPRRQMEDLRLVNQ